MRSVVVIVLAALTVGCGGTGEPGPDPIAPLDCPPGHLLDGNRCVPEACGIGPWGDIELTTDTVFVDASADADGDGSQSHPLTAIQDGADLARDQGSTRVAVAEGLYHGQLALDRNHDGIDVVGRCPDLVTLRCGDVDQLACVTLDGLYTVERGNVIEGLTIADSSYASVWMTQGTATLRDVVIRDGVHVGVYLEGAQPTLHMERVTVQNTWPSAPNSEGQGVAVRDGSTLTGDEVTVTGVTEVGLMVTGAGSTVDLTGVVIEDTKLSNDGDYGYGLLVSQGATAIIRGGLIQRNHRASVVLFHDDTVADLDEVTIVESLSGDDGSAGLGIYAEDGAALRLTSCAVESSDNIGIAITSGSSLDATALTVRDARRVAVMIDGPGTTAAMDDIELVGTLRDLYETTGSGLMVQLGARASITDLRSTGMEGPGLYVATGDARCVRCEFEGNGFAGAVLWDGRLHLLDNTIGVQIPDANVGGGVGVFAGRAYTEPTLVLEGTTIEAQQLASVWIDGVGTYRIEDSTLHGSEGVLHGSHTRLHGNAVYATGGVGPDVGFGGLSIRATTLADSSSAAILLHGASASLDGNHYDDNSIDLIQQSCSADLPAVEGVEEVPHSVVCPPYDTLVRSLSMGMYIEENELQE